MLQQFNENQFKCKFTAILKRRKMFHHFHNIEIKIFNIHTAHLNTSLYRKHIQRSQHSNPRSLRHLNEKDPNVPHETGAQSSLSR